MLPILKEGWIILLVLGLDRLSAARALWSPVGPRGVVFWCLLLAVIGLSTHLYLLIRAALHPMINEADPSTWHDLWIVLIRDQYKPANPFVIRKRRWSMQFGKHFWRYARTSTSSGFFRPVWVGLYLPYLVGLVGVVEQARRDRKTFLRLLLFYLITSRRDGLLPELQGRRGPRPGLLLHGELPVLRDLDRARVRDPGAAGRAGPAPEGKDQLGARPRLGESRVARGHPARSSTVRELLPHARPEPASTWRGTSPTTC